MKKIAAISILCVSWINGFSQLFGNAVETMLQQIAALEGYIKTAEKGYQIAEKGLQTIGEIKNGEFNLHSVFFASLKTVNPTVGQMTQVAEIMALQVAIVEKTSTSLQSYRQARWMSEGEVSYISQVYAALLRAGLADLDALVDLTTDGKAEMTDGDRISRIQAIDSDMRSQYSFLKSFSGKTGVLLAQREKEDQMIGSVRSLYGLP